MSDVEFINRLPDAIIHCDDGGFVEMCRTTQTDVFAIETGDPYCDPRMSWESWVAFAREIIAADEAARAGGDIASDQAPPSHEAAVEIVEYIGTLGHLFGGRDMRFLIDPSCLPIGTKLFIKKDETAGGS